MHDIDTIAVAKGVPRVILYFQNPNTGKSMQASYAFASHDEFMAALAEPSKVMRELTATVRHETAVREGAVAVV